MQPKSLAYVLELASTEASTGYFFCRPAASFSLEEMIVRLQISPYDNFMHTLLLKALSALSHEAFEALCQNAWDQDNLLLLTALYEISLLEKSRFRLKNPMKNFFAKKNTADFKLQTPLIVIKAKTSPDQDLHQQWIRVFRDNIFSHKPLPRPDDSGLPLVFTVTELKKKVADKVDSTSILEKHVGSENSHASFLPSPGETAQAALEKLEKTGILHNREMRHEASLSPYALLRQWRMNLSVINKRNRYTLSGIQTSYGRGLSLDAARASNLMEIAERYASFASFEGDLITGYKTGYRLTYGAFSSLQDQGGAVLDPNGLSLEAGYDNEPLHWIEAETAIDEKKESLLIPVQTVFPFCNLDEPDLFSGLASTGLASGNTLTQAKLSALLEIFERDAEATTPFVPALCFIAESDDPAVAPLLDAYRNAGINIFFQDITSGFGVPCCKCFVRGPDEKIAKGVGAHLCAKKALLSALTETPYPFPHGPRSGPAPAGLLRVPLEKLPDYATGDPDLDLAILEEILVKNGYRPIYLDLTREDTDIPVVRAVVPGLEIMADFDEFSRVSQRLFLNYLHLFTQKGIKNGLPF